MTIIGFGGYAGAWLWRDAQEGRGRLGVGRCEGDDGVDRRFGLSAVSTAYVTTCWGPPMGPPSQTTNVVSLCQRFIDAAKHTTRQQGNKGVVRTPMPAPPVFGQDG
jgi:hypothetical protein